jgi:hypothetical protein
LAAIPAGLILGLLEQRGVNAKAALALALVIGFLLALALWIWIGNRWVALRFRRP